MWLKLLILCLFFFSLCQNIFIGVVSSFNLHQMFYTCQLFFRKMREIFRLHRIWISEDLLTASGDCWWFRKTFEDRWRFPTTSEDFPTTSDGNRGVEIFSMTSKQGQQRFPNDFQPISSIIKEFQRCCSDDFSNVKKQLSFYLIGFKQSHSLLSARHEKLVWMSEVTILDPQAWDSRLMRESWHVYHFSPSCHDFRAMSAVRI